jgi:hypothetical protein
MAHAGARAFLMAAAGDTLGAVQVRMAGGEAECGGDRSACSDPLGWLQASGFALRSIPTHPPTPIPSQHRLPPVTNAWPPPHPSLHTLPLQLASREVSSSAHDSLAAMVVSVEGARGAQAALNLPGERGGQITPGPLKTKTPVSTTLLWVRKAPPKRATKQQCPHLLFLSPSCRAVPQDGGSAKAGAETVATGVCEGVSK